MPIADADNLNRLGIALDFLAGILLAPELLGKERIQRLESRLERLGKAILSVMNPITSGTQKPNLTERIVQTLIPVLTVHLFFWWFLWPRGDQGVNVVLIMAMCVSVIYLASNLGRLRANNEALKNVDQASGSTLESIHLVRVPIGLSLLLNVVFVIQYGLSLWALIAIGCHVWLIYMARNIGKFENRIVWYLLANLIVPVFAVLFWPMLLGVLFFWPVIAGTILAGRFLMFLTEPEQYRLKTIVTVTGIAVFIIGNALQLIATY